MAEPTALNIPENFSSAVTQKIPQNDLTLEGGDVTFMVEAHKAIRTEVFYSWVTFPAANDRSLLFHTYTATDVPIDYTAYEALEIPLT